MFLVLAADAISTPAPVVAPKWERSPTSHDLLRYYPDLAMRKGQGGRATMECKVLPQGDLAECKVLGEEPADFGFGEATLKMARFFKLAPTTPDGKSVGGGTIRIPLTFSPPGASPPPRLQAIEGIAACYGQLANAAEQKPDAPGIWRGAIYWSIQLQGRVAADFGRPSAAEDYARKARTAAQAGTLMVPKGFELKDCMAAIPK